MRTLFDLEEGEKRKDTGIQQVKDNCDEWFGIAMTQLERMRGWNNGQETTGEKIRLALKGLVGNPPNSQNSWGALIHHAIKRGYIKETGRWEKMTSPASHARRNPVYVFQ